MTITFVSRLRGALRAGLLAAVALGACASVQAAETSTAEVRAALNRAMPGLPADAPIIKTPYGGLYEVDFGGKIFYTDAKATFLIAGEIFDTKTGTNVTQARLEDLRRVDWKSLPFKDSFKVVYGNGQRQIAVFEDPYCPYCHQLEGTLREMSNVTMHVFIMPVIRANSPAQARKIWCAADRGKTWEAWMIDKTEPPAAPASCSDPFKANIALAQKLQIPSTPTLIFTDGSRIEGAVPRDVLEKKFAELKSKS